MTNRVLIEKKQLSDNLLHKISISKDQEDIFLNVDFMNGKFTIEKSFKNNFGGLHMLETTCEKLDSADKIFRYLRIGEENERIKS